MSKEEELFISAFSTASKAASLHKNLNGSEWEPYSSKATAGSDLAISSIEKLDGIESFMTPLSEEVIEKPDALLKVCKGASLLTAASDSIKGWLEKTIPDPPSSIDEVDHPLASSPMADTSGVTFLPQGTVTKEPLITKIKEEPMFPESGRSTPLSVNSTDPQPEAPSPGLGGQGKIPSSLRRSQPIGGSAPVAAPQKLTPKA